MKNHAWICTIHGNLKNVPKFSHSHISQSQWRNCEIIPTIRDKYSARYFVKKSTRILIKNMKNFIENHRHKNLLNDFMKLCNLQIFALIVCVDSVTPVPSWRHKVAAMYMTRKTVYIFYNARFLATRNLRADIGFAIYQNEIIHVIRGFKHDVPCIVRSGELRGTLGDVSAPRLVHWRLRVSPSCLQSHKCMATRLVTDASECPFRASDLTMHGTWCLNP